MFVHGKDTAVYGAEFDLSTYLNSTDVDQALETGDTTTYKKESKTYIGGQADGTFGFAGLWDGDAAAVDEAINAMIQSGGEPWSFAPAGFTLGNMVRCATSRLTSYTISSPVGDVVAIAIAVQGDGGLDLGKALHDGLVAETAAGSESGDDEGALSSNGGVAYVHLVALTGTNIDLIVQHSTTDASYIDLATFTSLTAVGSEAVLIAEGTTVNRWLRATWTGTFTSALFVVTFCRR